MKFKEALGFLDAGKTIRQVDQYGNVTFVLRRNELEFKRIQLTGWDVFSSNWEVIESETLVCYEDLEKALRAHLPLITDIQIEKIAADLKL